MPAETWTEAMTRISAAEAENIDPLIGRFDPRRDPRGRSLFPAFEPAAAPETPMKDPDRAVIGARLVSPPDDLAAYAARLLAFAMEHDVDIVVLSHLDYSGLEKFGFRTERIAGESEADRERCEAQLRRFWNIDLVV